MKYAPDAASSSCPDDLHRNTIVLCAAAPFVCYWMQTEIDGLNYLEGTVEKYRCSVSNLPDSSINYAQKQEYNRVTLL